MAAFLILIVVWSDLAVLSAEDSSARQEPLAFALLCERSQDCEELFVRVSVKDSREIGGLLASLEYDESAVRFSSAYLDESFEEKGFEFLAHEEEGEILFVLDGSENFSSESLATFVFESIDGGSEARFSLTSATAFEWREGSPEKIETDGYAETVIFAADDADGLPRISSVHFTGGSDQTRLQLSGSVQEGFAAGFDVCTFDLSDFVGQSYREMSVIGADEIQNKTFAHSVVLSDGGRFCIIVKPVAFLGKLELEGKEKIFMIEDGAPIY